MHSRSSQVWAIALLLLGALPAHAGIRIQAASMTFPGGQLSGLSASVQQTGSGELDVSLQVQSLDIDVLGWHRVGLTCQGRLSRPAVQQWMLKGRLALSHAAGGALRDAGVEVKLDTDENTLHLALDQSPRQLRVAWPLDQLGHMQVTLTRLPLGWLQGVLAQVWHGGRLGKGAVTAQLSVDVEDDGLRSAGHYSLSQAGFDSADGKLAGQGVDSQGHWSLATGKAQSGLDLDAQLSKGELLLGPLYADLPDSQTRLRLHADFTPQAIRLAPLHFDDGRAMRFDGSLDFDADGALEQVRVDGMRAVFPEAYRRYAKSMLGSAGYSDLGTDGMLTGSLVMDDSGLQRFALDAEGLDISDPSGRLGTQGLTGRLEWSRTGTREQSRLSWDSLTLLGLGIGPAATRWQSRDGALKLLAPVTAPMLGGKVFLDGLSWSPADTQQATRFDASVAYAGIDLSRLSQAFGWPAFKGTVGGAIPGLHYDGQRLELDGGVSVNVFNGFVDVTRLVLQHPFGSAPVLHAAVGFRDLDLKQMTQVFDFGSITGRLKGKVDGLRMISWRPVAFSARLNADQGGRISQKAINSISNLGGGGISGGLQSAMLRVFDSFGYSRIGLGCVLADDVCTMTGLAPAEGGGYTIVEGRGLPHISVIGHEHKVDWSTLVARLEAATSGGGVKIQ